jgi:hypothetical protein
MKESKFEELVNFYFDQEISAEELECLKKELATKVDLRREFQSRYRLHRATCSALSPQNVKLSEPVVFTAQKTYQARYMRSIMSGIGFAACLLVVFATSILVMREPASNVDTFVAETLDSSDEVQYVENQEQELQFQGSLTSQLHLAGLTPDLAPSNQLLSRFDADALRQREEHLQDVIEKIDRYKMYSAMPEQRLIEPFERTYEAPNNHWPSGFKSSLASFK